MTIVLICGGLVLVGIVLAVVWGGCSMASPPGSEDAGGGPGGGVPTGRSPLLRLAWRIDIAVISGLAAGLTVAGPGGRLAMRLLAATAGDAAQGRLTEAEEVVGRITTEGTIGLVVFGGLFAGLAAALGFAVLHRWLPSGRLGGLTLGVVMLVGGATRLDPLRADNPDFDLVGPSWLSLLVFGAVVVATGMVTAAVAGRLGRSLPLLSRRPAAVVAHLPLLLLLPMFPLLAGVVLLAVLALAVARFPVLARAVASRRSLIAGRVLLVGLVVVWLPGFLAAVADIAGRGPAPAP